MLLTDGFHILSYLMEKETEETVREKDLEEANGHPVSHGWGLLG